MSSVVKWIGIFVLAYIASRVCEAYNTGYGSALGFTFAWSSLAFLVVVVAGWRFVKVK